MSYPDALVAHLATGATTLARAYELRRKDGLVQGFTDHDRDLSFGGVTYRADTGLTAKALQQATGLSVDNTEAFGALRSDAITEEDILAGRYDGAEVVASLVNWTDVSMRVTQFRGVRCSACSVFTSLCAWSAPTDVWPHAAVGPLMATARIQRT